MIESDNIILKVIYDVSSDAPRAAQDVKKKAGIMQKALNEASKEAQDLAKQLDLASKMADFDKAAREVDKLTNEMRQLDRQTDELQRKPSRIGSAFASMGGLIAGVLAGLGVKELLVQLSDLAIRLDNARGKTLGLQRAQDRFKDSIRTAALVLARRFSPSLKEGLERGTALGKFLGVTLPAILGTTQAVFVRLGQTITRQLEIAGLQVRKFGLQAENVFFGATGQFDKVAENAKKIADIDFSIDLRQLVQEGQRDIFEFTSSTFNSKKAQLEKEFEAAGKDVAKVYGDSIKRTLVQELESLETLAIGIQNSLDPRKIASPEIFAEIERRIVNNRQLLIANEKQALADELTNLTNNQAAREKAISESSDRELLIRLEANKKLQAQGAFGATPEQILELRNEQAELEIALENSAARRAQKEIQIEREKREEIKKLLQQGVVDALEASAEIAAAEVAKTEALIEQQQVRLDAALNNTETFSEQQVQLEQDRLERLFEIRRRQQNRESALNALAIAANSAVAISEGITAVIKAFGSPGGLVTGIATSVSLIGTIGSTIAAISSAFSSVPSFFKGVESFDAITGKDGNGNFGLALLHENERVVPEKYNTPLLKAGISNEQLPDYAILGQSVMRNMRMQGHKIKEQYLATDSNTHLLNRIDKLTKEVKVLQRINMREKVNVSMDKRGLAVSVEEEIAKERNISKFRKA